MPFNIFKRKPKQEPKPERQEQERREEKAHKREERPGAKKAKSNAALPGVLLAPHATEKAAAMAEKGEYVFAVHEQASKGAVKQAVEALYGAAVQDVRFVKKPAKKVQLARRKGVKPGLRKAVVQVKKGEHLEVVSR